MPQMTYFRRSELAGKSLKRPTSAQLRGNLRRKDIDAFSPVPYFENVTQGDTLTVEGIDGNGAVAELTVGIPANASHFAALDQVISTLSGSLAALNISAFDDGGCIGLRSTLSGALGRVRVKGGTAAKALGFDLSVQNFYALGSDLASSIEGRGLGQPYNTALPTAGENLTTDAFVRALGRVMANTDVLFSDLMRREVSLKKVGTVSAAAGPQSFADLGSQKVFIGLSPTVTKEDLAHLFFFVDQETKQVSQCRVTGITNQANANILGQDQVVVAATAITGVSNGSVAECPAGNFQGAGVQEGDYVTISGAGNNVPFSHNGYRWVVEEVIDATHLKLRPMSKVELQAVGATFDENQPIVELNSNPSGAWGNLAVSRGPFAASARLQVSPPIPKGASYDIWAPVPASLRERELHRVADRGYGIFSSLTHDFDPAPNGILSRPSLVKGASNVTVGPFMVRFHGRPVRVPGQTFTPGPGAATWYIYWDEVDCQLKSSLSPAIFVSEARDGSSADELAGRTPNTTGKGQLIASVTTNVAGSVQVVTPASRLVADFSQPITVGHGAQFSLLDHALEHLRRLAASGYARGQMEVVVLSDQVAPTSGWTLPGISLHISGGAPGVKLLHGPAGPLFQGAGTDSVLLSDLTVDLTKIIVQGAGSWWFRGLSATAGGAVRTIDSNGPLDIGASSTSQAVGKAGTTASFRGHLTVDEGFDVDGDVDVRGAIDVLGNAAIGGDVNIPSGRMFQSGGEVGAGKAAVFASGGQGFLRLGKNSEADVDLSKDQLDNVVGVLLGGPAVNADLYHIHKALQANFTIGGVATSNLVTAANLNTLTAGANSNADALHIHKALQSQFTIGGVATSANVSATNLNTLVAGGASNADALHTHPGLSPAGHTHPYVALNATESIAGVKTFGSYPKIQTPSTFPTQAGEFIPKQMFDQRSLVAAAYIDNEGAILRGYNVEAVSLLGWSPVGGKMVNGYYRVQIANVNWPASETSLIFTGTLGEFFYTGDLTTNGGDQHAANGPVVVEIESFGSRWVKVRPTVIYTNNNDGNYLGCWAWKLKFYLAIHRIGA